MRSRTVAPARCLAVLGALGALLLVGCDSLTDVDAPDVRVPEDYATVAGASALATGAVTRFVAAFGGATDSRVRSQVALSGLVADELYLTGLNLVSREWDSRDAIEPAPADGYIPLQQARINLLTAIASLQRAAPDSSARIGELFALIGYTEVFLGENYCSGVPLSRLDAEFNPIYGQPLTTVQMYEQAVADFDSALGYAAGNAAIVSLAAVGKGRALVNLAQFSAAATAVATVPTNAVYRANYVPGTQTGTNSVFAFSTGQILTWFTVLEREGTNGLPWRTAADPRVPLVNRSPAIMGSDGVTEIWQFGRYQAANAAIPLATGIEARLIEAEAALQAGDTPGWLGIHNTLRATVPGLAALADPGTDAARVDLHFRERAFWLFLTGHRHGDLRRLVRQYGRNVETIFPTGVWRAGLAYGSATNLAVSADEFQNPNYTGCLNRDA